MAEHVGSTLQGNDKLRSKLFSDDTEKLRRKLAYLQREYSKTQQRLKRAERSEAVKKHVRTRITEQNSLHLPQVDPDTSTTRPNVDSSSPSHRRGSPTCEITGPPQDQDHTEGRVEADGGRKSTAVRFLLPSEATAAAAPPLTPASGQDARDRRPGPAPGSALRLRSRSSRLRWQQRCSGSGEEGPEPGGRPGDSGGTPEVVVETQEGRRSGEEPGSPSLLLTHWNVETRAAGGAGLETTGRAPQRDNGTGEDVDGESPSLLLPHWTPAPPAGRRAREDAPDHTGTDAAEAERAGGLESGVSDGEPQRRDREADGGPTGEGHQEGKAGDGGSHAAVGPTDDRQRGGCEGEGERRRVGEASLRASFWPEEGLLFPPEYYVRTTRRMTSSQQQQQQQQQQPDMQDSLFSDLIGTSRTRGRGRARGQHPRALQDRQDHSDTAHAWSDGPAQMGSPGSSREAPSSSEKASEPSADDQNHECFISAAASARPARDRKRKRGRPRGRSFDGGSFCSGASRADREQTAHRRVPRPPSPCLPVAVPEPGPGLVPLAPAFVSQPSESPPALPPGVPPSALEDGPAPALVSGCLEQVYPIFRRSGSLTERPPHDVCWRSLLLPSPPGPGGPLLQLPRPAPGAAAEPLVATDFHLPDEQFGSLKLHKLRQAMEAAAEPFSPPSYHTRRSSQQAYHLYAAAAAAGGEREVAALSLPLSPTPPLSESVLGRGDDDRGDVRRHPAAAPSRPIGEHGRMDARVRPGSTPGAGADGCRPDPGDRRPGGGRPPTGGPEPVGPGGAGAPAGQSVREKSAGQEPLTGTAPEGSAEHPPPTESPPVLTERGGGDVGPSEDRGATDHQRAEGDHDCDFPAEETVGSPFECNSNCQTKHGCMDPAVQEERRTTCLADRTTGSPPDGSAGGPPPRPGTCSQLLLSPSLVSPPCPLLAPPLLPSTGPPSPPLPSLGLTPRPALACRPPLTSSPCAPRLTLPPPVSPSSLALSPPGLSPDPFPLSPAPASRRQTPASLDPPLEVGGQPPGAVPGHGPSVSAGPVDPQPPRAAGAADGTEGAVRQAGGPAAVAEECAVSITHTLTAPAGGGLVDACCVPGPSGGLCVAAAGKWAVCVWDQTPSSSSSSSSSSSGWGLIHTWTFNKPVISVFSVPDSAGLLCVTLGQLEIREVRVLSCSGLVEALLCQGVVQAAVGVARARVVCSSHSAAVSALQLFALSEDSSAPAPRPLVSPGTRVGALATVDGLPDALLGSAEGGHLFLWNLGTGQLLQRILLDKGLTHTACLRGYSYSGVLFVLLQHQYLGSIAREEVQSYHRDSGVVSMEKENERPKTTLFSLVAVNALSGKSVVANQLHQPEAWSGRLCEADVLGSRLVALSQSGSVHVWDLGGPGGPRAAWAPEADGWHVARWGAADMLVTGHQNGDLTLHRYGDRQTAVVADAADLLKCTRSRNQCTNLTFDLPGAAVSLELTAKD